MILGGDYSLYDQILDWANHTWRYAFIKVSEGIIEDPVFSRQWKASKGYVYRGGYHFFRPMVPWRTAAEKFMSLMNREEFGELPAVLDLEVYDGVSNERIRDYSLEWLRFVHRESGKRPIIYTSLGFAGKIEMFRSIDYADYVLWQAAYPFDKIDATWSEEQRSQRINEIILGSYDYKFPVAIRPWQDVGRGITFVQWTGKCPPEYVPGYPLGIKKAVDVNFYKLNLQDLIFQFQLPELEGGPVSAKPVTWTATLIAGQTANLRSGPGKTYAIRQPIVATTGDLPFKGTGVKTHNPVDNFYWGEVLLPVPGWIAFTSSFKDVVWLENPPQPTTRKAIGSRIFYDDGTYDDIGTVP